MDVFFGELVVRQRVLALQQLELRRRHEGPKRAALGADRAVALPDRGQIGGGLEAYAAAMATALVCSGVGHLWPPAWVAPGRRPLVCLDAGLLDDALIVRDHAVEIVGEAL